MVVFGRSVPAVMTYAPAARYMQQVRWLKLVGVYDLLMRIGQYEFGQEVPYNLGLWRFRKRLQGLVNRRVH